MADHRIQCPVVNTEVEVQEADAFRVFPDGGHEFLLDFVRSSAEAAGSGEVVARLRVHRDVLLSIHDRLLGSISEPEAVLFSVPLGG